MHRYLQANICACVCSNARTTINRDDFPKAMSRKSATYLYTYLFMCIYVYSYNGTRKVHSIMYNERHTNHNNNWQHQHTHIRVAYRHTKIPTRKYLPRRFGVEIDEKIVSQRQIHEILFIRTTPGSLVQQITSLSPTFITNYSVTR